MTPAEFKAWFEGFCEGIGEKPNADQWKRIREQVKKIAAPVTIDWPRDYPARPLPATPNWPTYPHIGSPPLVGPTTIPLPRYPVTYSVGGRANVTAVNIN